MTLYANGVAGQDLFELHVNGLVGLRLSAFAAGKIIPPPGAPLEKTPNDQNRILRGNLLLSDSDRGRFLLGFDPLHTHTPPLTPRFLERPIT